MKTMAIRSCLGVAAVALGLTSVAAGAVGAQVPNQQDFRVFDTVARCTEAGGVWRAAPGGGPGGVCEGPSSADGRTNWTSPASRIGGTALAPTAPPGWKSLFQIKAGDLAARTNCKAQGGTVWKDSAGNEHCTVILRAERTLPVGATIRPIVPTPKPPVQ